MSTEKKGQHYMMSHIFPIVGKNIYMFMNMKGQGVININKTSDERTLLESGQSLYQHKQMTKDVGRPTERTALMHLTKYRQAIVQAKGYNVNKERTFPQKQRTCNL